MRPGRGTLGCAVPGRLGGIVRGRVCAVFARCAHVCVPGGFVTVGAAELPAHPYTVASPGYAGLALGQGVAFTPLGVEPEGGAALGYQGLRLFTPHPLGAGVGPEGVGPALGATRRGLAATASRGGIHQAFLLARGQVGGRAGDPLADALAEACLRQARLLAQALPSGWDWPGGIDGRDGLGGRDWPGLRRAACGLAGLGVGLTPAGDDFLGGVLAALHRLHAQTHSQRGGAPEGPARRVRPADATRLAGAARLDASGCTAGAAPGSWQQMTQAPPVALAWVAGAATAATSDFSGFLLRCAARGLIGEPAWRWLSAALAGDAALAEAGVAGLARIGHSSGLDFLCGMLLALEIANGDPPWTN